MAIAASIDVDRRQAAMLMSAIRRDAKAVGGSLRNSLVWGGIKVTQSLKEPTNVAKQTLRKVIENPDSRWKTDGRRAQWGVMYLRQNKKPTFVPIYKTGEFGKIVFRSKKTGEMMVRDKVTGKVRRQSFETGNKPDQVPGIMQSEKRKIGHRGFARKSWGFLRMRVNRGGAIYIEGIPDMGEVRWTGGKENPTLTINNRVSYIHKIMRGGDAAVGNAMQAAASGMMYQIDNGIRKRMGAK